MLLTLELYFVGTHFLELIADYFKRISRRIWYFRTAVQWKGWSI